MNLKNYRFIDELPDLHYGSYIRWITIKDPQNIKLTNGGIVCEMKVGDDGIIVVCKNKMNRFFSFKMNILPLYFKDYQNKNKYFYRH